MSCQSTFPSPRVLIPRSAPVCPRCHHFSAPTLGTRSPPKSLSAASSRDDSSKSEHSSHLPADDSQDPRFARLKQREQTSTIPTNLANVSSHATNDKPDPTKWGVQGTSVQSANAIHQAAMALNPNDSWASSTRTIVPRSTSVEYEKETQSTSTRRLNPPPRKGPPTSRSAAAAVKLSKQQSVRYVPDSEEGEDAGEASQGRQERAKTPLESVVDLAKRTAFYLRQRSTEPELGPSETSQNGHHNNESYDYEAEEREFQSHSATTKGRKANNAALAKRGRISVDNKAYRPSQSDLEDSDDNISDDGKRRRRKSKKSMIGPLTTLPVVGQEKRRRRRRSTKADGGDEEGEEKEDSGSDSRVSPQVCQPIRLITGSLGTNLRPSSVLSIRHSDSLSPQTYKNLRLGLQFLAIHPPHLAHHLLHLARHLPHLAHHPFHLAIHLSRRHLHLSKMKPSSLTLCWAVTSRALTPSLNTTNPRSSLRRPLEYSIRGVHSLLAVSSGGS